MFTFLTLVASFILSVLIVIAEPLAPTALFRRQLTPDIEPNQVPSACNNVCQPYIQAFTGTCVDPSCFCTNAVASSYEGCLSCALKENFAGFTQADLDDAEQAYFQACADAGFPISGSGLSGGGNSPSPTTGSTASGSATTGSAATGSTGTGIGTTAASTQSSDPISGGGSSSSKSGMSETCGASD